MKLPAAIMFALTLSSFAWAKDSSLTMSDGEIKRQMIQESIGSYSGSCPCPYNVTRNGAACGGRSAYSRPGGESPLCYARDITPQMVSQWRAEHGN